MCRQTCLRGSLLLYSLDKLLATIQTILVSFKSTFCVFFFRTLFHGNVFIYQLAAHWAKAHWSVSTSMIKVSAIVSPRYHLFLLPIHISMVFSRWVLRSYLSSSGTGRRFLQALATAPGTWPDSPKHQGEPSPIEPHNHNSSSSSASIM